MVDPPGGGPRAILVTGSAFVGVDGCFHVGVSCLFHHVKLTIETH